MFVILSNHASLRINQKRQKNITKNDVIKFAESIPGTPNKCLKFSNDKMSIVIKDINKKRLVITVIGR